MIRPLALRRADRGPRHTRPVSTLAALVAAVEAAPADPDPQLVLADCLQAAGDPRGELIVLDHHDRATLEGLDDPEAIERLLLLAAVYGFPCAEPALRPLPFRGGGASPVQYEVAHAGHHYYVRYRHEDLSVTIDEGEIDSGVDYPDGFPGALGLCSTDEWTDEETLVILTILSDAIRAGTPLPSLLFPFTEPALPIYPGAPLRCYALPQAFTAPRGLGPRDHGLAARDYRRWHRLWTRLQRAERARPPAPPARP